MPSLGISVRWHLAEVMHVEIEQLQQVQEMHQNLDGDRVDAHMQVLLVAEIMNLVGTMRVTNIFFGAFLSASIT